MNNIKKDALIFLSFLCFGSVLSSLLRFEIFADLINYHYYNGFSFLNNRLTYDVAPAGFHSFFNPLADTVTYLLVRTLNDRPAVYFALTGLPFGILLFVCFKINLLFFSDKRMQIVSMILAITGFSVWSQIGTSSHEIAVSIPVLTALYFLLKEEKESWAAFLSGAAAGLKLTAMIYSMSFCILFFLFHPKDLKKIFLFISCCIAGFLVTNGFWMYRLNDLYGNPFFPFLNAWFQSPYFEAVNFFPRMIEAPHLPYLFSFCLYC